MEVRIEEGWKKALADVWDSDYFASITSKVRELYKTSGQGAKRVYPPASKIFRAFDLCPFDKTKVVIIGQDPYHGPGQANGLAFSVSKGIAAPPSLVNIFKEIADDTGQPSRCSADGDLTPWAAQGVLLLNSSLTVEEGAAASHRYLGWEIFTDAAISRLAHSSEGLVFLLWGAHALSKAHMIDSGRHLVLAAPHPSPLSAYRGFFGCRHFSQTNQYLVAHGKSPIIW